MLLQRSMKILDSQFGFQGLGPPGLGFGVPGVRFRVKGG